MPGWEGGNEPGRRGPGYRDQTGLRERRSSDTARAGLPFRARVPYGFLGKPRLPCDRGAVAGSCLQRQRSLLPQLLFGCHLAGFFCFFGPVHAWPLPVYLVIYSRLHSLPPAPASSGLAGRPWQTPPTLASSRPGLFLIHPELDCTGVAVLCPVL